MCGNPSLTFHSFGTKAIVEEVRNIFPEARILRFDTDNSKSERLEHQYTNILNGQADILIGTQMLAKGLDLPRLSTLGIILADSSLYVPDYTAQEKTYQLLTQVVGRVGRGHVDSRVILQTYNPNSSLTKAALSNDWDAFYSAEITEREKYFFPPFSYILKLTVARSTAHSAEVAAIKFKQHLLTQQWHIQVDGPAPAFHEKAGGQFIWQLIVKARNRKALLGIIAILPSGWNYDIDPANLI
jgi:primosomal protein N' (replication factor Y)